MKLTANASGKQRVVYMCGNCEETKRKRTTNN